MTQRQPLSRTQLLVWLQRVLRHYDDLATSCEVRPSGGDAVVARRDRYLKEHRAMRAVVYGPMDAPTGNSCGVGASAPADAGVAATLDRASIFASGFAGDEGQDGLPEAIVRDCDAARGAVLALVDVALRACVHLEDYRDGALLRNEQEVASVAIDLRNLQAAIDGVLGGVK